MDGGRPEKERLLSLLEKGVENDVFPGAAAGIVYGPPERRGQWTGYAGSCSKEKKQAPIKVDTFFDLASLTKAMATVPAVLALLTEKIISINDCLPELLACPIPEDKKEITLQQLLSHSSGLAAHKPYYQHLKNIPLSDRKTVMQELILAEPLVGKPGEKAVYSDLGFMLLGFIIEEKTGVELDSFVANKIYKPLSLAEHLFYKPLHSPWPEKSSIAATENCLWRNKLLVGEVSDDNTYVLGGVAGQAGMFGDLTGVLSFAAHLLDYRQGRDYHPSFSNDLFTNFVVNYEKLPNSSWMIGFDTPSPQGSSSGRYLGPASFGHLGFTGTSFWIDPDRDLVIVLLTNRVNPSRENNKIKEFRPLFHDLAVEFINSLAGLH